MTIAESIQNRVAQLPESQQRVALQLIEELASKVQLAPSRRDLSGLLKGMVDLSLEDFQENRREMSKNFPREFPE